MLPCLSVWPTFLDSVLSSHCGKIGFLPNGHAHIRIRVSGTNLCAEINRGCILFLTQTYFEGWQKEWIFFVYVMEGSVIFCQKNILQHSLNFFLGRWFATNWDAYYQILSFTRLIPEIKSILHQRDFSLHHYEIDVHPKPYTILKQSWKLPSQIIEHTFLKKFLLKHKLIKKHRLRWHFES